MKLSLNIHDLVMRYGAEKAFALTKEAGFDAVDYSLQPMEQHDSAFNGEKTWQSAAEEVKRIADGYGLPITQTHAPFSFSGWKDPKEYEEFIIPAIKRSVIISAMIGAKVAVVHPLHHFTYKGHEEEIFEKNMDFYRSLIPICKEYGIKVGIENMFQRELLRGHISFDTCATIPEFLRYVDTLDSEYMVACLDVGHVGLPTTDDEAWDFIRALGHDRLQALHVHDNDYRMDKHTLPYYGKINWARVTEALGEIDYQGDFTYELSISSLVPPTMSEKLVKASLSYFETVGRELCDMTESKRIIK